MRLIAFPHVFRGTDEQDLKLADTLRSELPGILNWSLRGLGELLDSGVQTFPETTQAATVKAELIKATRPEELFCDEMLVRMEGEVESTEKVYEEFQKFECVAENV